MDSNEFGFDEDQESAATQSAASDLIQELESPGELVNNEVYMEDVDRRLDVASTYRQLLRASLFEAPTESTVIVENEIREFVIQRLKILLNMAPAPAPVQVIQTQLPFDEQELKTLKILLSSLAERAAKKAETPSGPPQVAKASAPIQPPSPPTIRRATAPVSVPVIQPKAPAKPVGRPPGPTKAPKTLDEDKDLREIEDPRSGQTILTRRPRRQVRSKTAIPMPSGQELEGILHAQALGSGAAMGARTTDESITSATPLGASLIANALASEE